MRGRWSRWRRAQRSHVRYALVPGPVRLIASGPRSTVRVVEVFTREVAWL